VDTSTTYPDEKLESLNQHIAALMDWNRKSASTGVHQQGMQQTGSVSFQLAAFQA